MHHVSHQGQQFGPYSVEQINQYLAQGVLDGSTFVWDQNTNGWIKIGQLPGVILPAHQAQPASVTPVQNVSAQQKSEVASASGEKKKPKGVKKQKTNEEKIRLIKIGVMFGIAGVMVWFLLIPFAVSVLDADKPPAAFGTTIKVPRYMSGLITLLIFAWIVVCVMHPFKGEKKKEKKK